MTTLILKTLKENGKLNRVQLMVEVEKHGIISSKDYMEAILENLEKDNKITKLTTGEYEINGRLQKFIRH